LQGLRPCAPTRNCHITIGEVDVMEAVEMNEAEANEIYEEALAEFAEESAIDGRVANPPPSGSL